MEKLSFSDKIRIANLLDNIGEHEMSDSMVKISAPIGRTQINELLGRLNKEHNTWSPDVKEIFRSFGIDQNTETPLEALMNEYRRGGITEDMLGMLASTLGESSWASERLHNKVKDMSQDLPVGLSKRKGNDPYLLGRHQGDNSDYQELGTHQYFAPRGDILEMPHQTAAQMALQFFYTLARSYGLTRAQMEEATQGIFENAPELKGESKDVNLQQINLGSPGSAAEAVADGTNSLGEVAENITEIIS